MYAQVVFPLPFRKAFTYRIPPALEELVCMGVRVVVPFGKRVMTGYVLSVGETTDVKEKVKPISDVLDEQPIFDESSIKFYEWLSDYYLCSLGEAFRNAVPYGSDVESKRKIISDTKLCSELLNSEKKKSSVKAKLLRELVEKETHKISQLQKAVKRKSIYSALKTLEKQGALTILDLIEEAKVKAKKAKYVKLAKTVDEVYETIPEIESRSPKQVVILLELLTKPSGEIQQSDLLNKTNTNQSSIKSLEKKGLIQVFSKKVERVYEETYAEEKKNIKLTAEQSEIVKQVKSSINKSSFISYLLYGVTGSGKTQVYIELAKQAVKKGKTALVLVPEISLTPQITSRFFNTFGDETVVIHSRLSLGERYDAWRGIIRGKYNVVIGPRSALFAPLKNIGLIVIDEEHDASYKQFEMIPKYHARDSAIIKAKFSKCPVLLGSATPSIETMQNAISGKYKLLELKNRVDNARLPAINLVDVSSRKNKGKVEKIFSNTLIDAIHYKLSKKESIILLQNRRGFSTQVFCDDCGTIEMCPDCDVSLVHHISKNILQCHYCGFTKKVPKACSNCGSLSLRFFGTGTQRVEDELAYHFPDARIERIDSDTMGRKGELGFVLNSFRKGEIDILVGTQMVSKGLDFSRVTLVGVISAETTLWLPDFRADERTFQLLTQVSGRAGRSENPGEVIIQSLNPRHFVLQKVLANDYLGFFKKELLIREAGQYPPFTKLALVEAKDENEQDAYGAINDYYKMILPYKNQVTISPPTPALISKIKGRYRFHILLRTHKREDASGHVLRTAMSNALSEYNQKSRFRDLRLLIDIDPVSIV